MSTLRQVRAVTAMSLGSLPERLGNSCVIVIGIAGVVGVLVTVLSMATSLSDALVETGRDDRAIVLRNGSNAEVSSGLGVDATLTIVDAPGIARTAAGEPVATIDMVTAINLPKRADGNPAGLTLRGMSAQALAVRPEIELVEGRMFRPGLREFIVGEAAQDEFVGLGIGDTVAVRDSDWSIVGTFVTGDALETSLLTDLDTILSAYQRTGGSSVTVVLESEDAFELFSDALNTNPTLDVEVMRETEYYAQQSQQLRNILTIVSFFIGGIMAVGALFAALNTMYSAVSARSVEIATLRAIGFGATGVVTSVLVESLLLAFVGALLGAALAWLLFSGNTINLGNVVGTVIYQLRITPSLLGIGIVWALSVGFIGGLLPALRAARLPVATALRAS